MKHLQIQNFVKPEIEYIKSMANFTEEETAFFDLRAKGKSLIEVCFAMNVSRSKADSLSKSVKKKIIRIL